MLGHRIVALACLFSAVAASYGQSIANLALSPTSVGGGSNSRATITLSAAAPASGLTVTLASDSAAATVPVSDY